MQHRGVEIVNSDDVLNGLVTELIGQGKGQTNGAARKSTLKPRDLPVLGLLNLDHLVIEGFLDSDTVRAVINGIPTAEWNKHALPTDLSYPQRKLVNLR